MRFLNCLECTISGQVTCRMGREPVLDEITICKFRHLMERRVWGDSTYAGQKQVFFCDRG